MRSILLFLAISFFNPLIGQISLIKGSITSENGKTIKALIYQDYFTNELEELGNSKIQDGSFELKLDLKETMQVVLKIEDKTTSLFVEPGQLYNVQINFDESKNQGRAYDKQLDIQFLLPKANETNTIIKNFNQSYQDFFTRNYAQFVVKGAKKELDKFILKSIGNIPEEASPYAKNYIIYALANLQDINRVPRDSLFNKYIKGKDVLVKNKEYINFFRQFYQQDFEQLTLEKQGKDIMKAIVLDENLNKTIQAIDQAKNFNSSELAELYLLQGLFETYHKKRIKQRINIQFLEELMEKSDYESTRRTAKNMLKNLRLYQPNTSAPEFKLADLKGEIKSLSDYNGKYIYLNFWANWSIPSLREMQIIKELETKYGSDIQFISINLDPEKSEMENAVSRFQFDWTQLYNGNSTELKEAYEVKSVPSYFLISPNGKLKQAFAPGPQDIERTLFNLSN